MIAAVVVTHSATTLQRCLAALAAGGGVDRVIVVDNGARGTIDAPGFDPPGVELIVTPNRGYGAAANVGFRRACELGATAIALLNDDVFVRPGWLAPLLAELRHERVGAVQPKLLIADTSPARVNSLGVLIGADGAGTDIGDGWLDDPGDGAGPASEIDVFTGGAVLLAPSFLAATGGFDERWFLYYEDADLAARGAALGWRYRLVPGSEVEHARGSTTSGDSARTRFLQERNRLWHAFRHCDAATVRGAVWLSVRRLRHAPRRVHAQALLAGLAGAPGALWRRARHADSLR
jgi:GT2 family glycosyltransferase